MSLLGRPLDSILIVDNAESNFMKHPDNGILIKEWTGDLKDKELFKLADTLTEILNQKKEMAHK